MKNIKQIFKIRSYFCLIFIFAALFSILPESVMASELYFESSNAEYHPGDTFIADLKINNQKECINAISADIKFSEDLLEAVDFIKSDSILVFWVGDPSIRGELGSVSFTGGIPGGYCGKAGEDSGSGDIIGKIVFKVKEGGAGDLKLAEIKFLETSEVFLNDGLGTKANLSFKRLDLKITGSASQTGDEWREEKASDIIPPEPFTIEIVADPKVFEGRYFAVFNASDKQTGVDHYEVRENNGSWIKAESPYLLKDQSLKNSLEVKAVDKAGNERLADPDKKKIEQKTEPGYLSDFYYIFIAFLSASLFLLIIKTITSGIRSKK